MLLALSIFHLIGFSKSTTMKSFIVDGCYAKIGRFPYTALLSIQCRNSQSKPARSWRCGSSIINQLVTLTAAHCVVSEICDKVTITVSMGHVDIKKACTSSTDRYLSHCGYDSDLRNDIAIVILRRPLVFSPKVNRVAIIPSPPYKERAQIAGWGRIHPNKRNMTDTLKYTYYTVLDKQYCLRILGSIPEGTFCALSSSHGRILNGDSGSGLIVQHYIQIGISSYFKPDITSHVVVFTDVGYYYDWITENMKAILCQS